MLLISNNVAFLISNFQLMETFCCSNLPAWGSPQSLRPCPHPHRPQDTQDLLWALSRMPQQGSMLRNNLIYVRDSRGRSGIMASANVSWLKYFWVLKPPSYSRKIKIKGRVFLKKWANPGLFFVYFRSFQTNITIFTTNICEKCPSSIWCRDSNPRPLEHKSLPITTRPGLPPLIKGRACR